MKQIQSLFQGLAIVTVEYTQILLTFSRPNWMATYNRNGPVQHIIFTGRAAKENKSNPVRHGRHRVRSIKQEDLS
jgi:hypothetical protein